MSGLGTQAITSFHRRLLSRIYTQYPGRGRLATMSQSAGSSRLIDAFREAHREYIGIQPLVGRWRRDFRTESARTRRRNFFKLYNIEDDCLQPQLVVPDGTTFRVPTTTQLPIQKEIRPNAPFARCTTGHCYKRSSIQHKAPLRPRSLVIHGTSSLWMLWVYTAEQSWETYSSLPSQTPIGLIQKDGNVYWIQRGVYTTPPPDHHARSCVSLVWRSIETSCLREVCPVRKWNWLEGS